MLSFKVDLKNVAGKGKYNHRQNATLGEAQTELPSAKLLMLSKKQQEPISSECFGFKITSGVKI